MANESVTGGFFTYESGKSLISNYSGEDVIYIPNGTVDAYTFDGNDLVFTIGEGILRLKNMKGRAVTILYDIDGEPVTQIYGTGYSAQDVIKNLVKAWSKTLLTDTAKLDESIKLCSHFNSIQDAIDQMISDCEISDSADTFLREKCGIILDNIDTGAITGWDAGGLSVKTAEGVVPENSDVQHLGNYSKATFTTAQGVTINLTAKSDTLTDTGKKILDGLYSWWAQEALNLVEESYGVEFASGTEINIALTSSATYSGLTSGNSVTINTDAATFDNDDDYNGNGIDRTIAHEFTHIVQNFFLGYFPQFLHEGLADLTCGIDDRRRNYVNYLAGHADSLASYLDVEKSGTGSAFHYAAGYMFYRYLTKQAADNYDSLSVNAWEDNVTLSGSDDADFLSGNGNNQTLTAGAGNDTITAYGKAAQVHGEAGDDYVLTNGDALAVYGGAGSDTLKNRGGNSTLSGGADSDLLVNGEYWSEEGGGANVVLLGGDGNDTLTNRACNVELYGGDNDDLIYNGYRFYEPSGLFYPQGADEHESGYFLSDSVTISAGAGNDTVNNSFGANLLIKYAAGDGNDLITGFRADSTLSISGAAYSTTASGSDVLVTVGDEKITLRGAASLESVNIDGTEILSLTDADSIKVSLGSTIELADASARNKPIVLVGNKLDNSIVGSSGNDLLWGGLGNDCLRGGKGADKLWGSLGNDTLLGDTGNDTLYGGTGNDLFVSRAGHDVIADYATGDRISLGAALGDVILSGSDVVLTLGSGSLTIKDAKGKQLDLITSSGSELSTIISGAVQ